MLKPDHVKKWIEKNFLYRLSKNGQQIRICNPDGDKAYNLYINTKPERNKKGSINYWVHDFRPNHQQYDGSFIRFVMKYRAISFARAIKEITNEIVYLKHDEVEEKKNIETNLTLPEGSKPLYEKDENKNQKIAQNYLRKRAINNETICKHRLHYTATTIVFPYQEFDEIVYWQERSFYDKIFRFPDETKTGRSKSDFLYGFDNVEIGGDELIIVESIFNCLSIGDNCVATGGAQIPDRSGQIKKIKFFNSKILILAPDSDQAGIKSLIKNYYLLKDLGFKMAYSLPPDNVDWNDMDQREIGSARSYVERNTFWLNLNVLAKLSMRI